MKINSWIRIICSFVIFLFLSIYITFPLIFHLGDYSTGFGDELVIAWIQNWVIHALTTNPFSLFEANIYYPYHNSLAFSEHFLISSILSILPYKIIGEPIAVVNFTLISSLIMLGFFMYLLIYYLTKDFILSILGGLLIIFSPVTLDKVVHLQILSIQWIPLSLLFFLIFLNKYKTRYLILSLVFFVIQTYNSFLPGYFIIFTYLILYVNLYIYKRIVFKKVVTKRNILITFLFILLLIPIIVPYYKVSREFNYTRDIRDAIHFALQPQDLLYPNQYTKFQASLVKIFPSNSLSRTGYVGFAFSILTIITLVYFLTRFKKKEIAYNSFVITAIFGLLMSFGPLLHWNGRTIHDPFPVPLPYALLYYIFPGFQGIRNSARWEMLFVLMMSVAISWFLFRVLKEKSSIKRNFMYIILISIVVIEYNFPMKFVEVPQKKDFPKVYKWLTTTSQNAKVIELPIYNWNMWPYTHNELLRQYYGTIHFRKTVNGYSGFSPIPWQKMIVETMSEFPSGSSISYFKKIGVNYIVIHKNEFDLLNKKKFKVNERTIRSGDEIIDALYNYKQVSFVKQFDGDYVFSL